MRYPIRFSGSFDAVPSDVMAAAEAALASTPDAELEQMRAVLLTNESLRQLDIGGWRFVYRINARVSALEVLAASPLAEAAPG